MKVVKFFIVLSLLGCGSASHHKRPKPSPTPEPTEEPEDEPTVAPSITIIINGQPHTCTPE